LIEREISAFQRTSQYQARRPELVEGANSFVAQVAGCKPPQQILVTLK